MRRNYLKKVYLAHSISTKGEFEDSKRVAELIRELGYDVYVASENLKINDKSLNPTPKDIYEGDVSQILDSDIFVVNINGNLQDGTISEIGIVAGYNEAEDNHWNDIDFGEYEGIKIIAYTSNARLLQPQFYKDIPSASANHLVLGMVDKWGTFVGTEGNMLKKLKEIK